MVAVSPTVRYFFCAEWLSSIERHLLDLLVVQSQIQEREAGSRPLHANRPQITDPAPRPANRSSGHTSAPNRNTQDIINLFDQNGGFPPPLQNRILSA